jgi:glycosyltransferase involved in cell wall biosynthesis
MRIAYLAGSAIPSRSANSVHVMKMCAAFAANGHDVTLLVPGRRPEGGAPDPFQFYGVPPAFRVRRLLRPPAADQALLFAWRAALELLRLKPQLAYGRDIAACAAAAAAGFPVILESHMPAWLARGRAPRRFARLAKSPRLTRLVVVSEALKRAYAERGPLEADRILVAHDGADEVGDFSPRPEWPGRGGALQVGYAGQLYEGKGIPLILDVAARAPDADFHIVGGEADSLAQWRRKASGAVNVFFHGFVPHASLGGYINRFDVCLLPNQRVVRPADSPGGDIGQFTSPLKMFEYMAHRKCILASDLSVLREVLNESNAALAPPDDPAAWRVALDRLRDQRLRAALAGRAHADFLAKYTWKRRAQAVLAPAAAPRQPPGGLKAGLRTVRGCGVPASAGIPPALAEQSPSEHAPETRR